MRTLGNSTLGVAMGMAKSRQRAFRFTLDNPTERDVVRASRFGSQRLPTTAQHRHVCLMAYTDVQLMAELRRGPPST